MDCEPPSSLIGAEINFFTLTDKVVITQGRYYRGKIDNSITQYSVQSNSLKNLKLLQI